MGLAHALLRFDALAVGVVNVAAEVLVDGIVGAVQRSCLVRDDAAGKVDDVDAESEVVRVQRPRTGVRDGIGVEDGHTGIEEDLGRCVLSRKDDLAFVQVRVRVFRAQDLSLRWLGLGDFHGRTAVVGHDKRHGALRKACTVAKVNFRGAFAVCIFVVAEYLLLAGTFSGRVLKLGHGAGAGRAGEDAVSGSSIRIESEDGVVVGNLIRIEFDIIRETLPGRDRCADLREIVRSEMTVLIKGPDALALVVGDLPDFEVFWVVVSGIGIDRVGSPGDVGDGQRLLAAVADDEAAL